MGILKLIIAFLVIGSIAVIAREAIKRRNKEKLTDDLTDELDTIDNAFARTDLEIDVVDAKAELKEKREVLAEKVEELAGKATEATKPDADVEFTSTRKAAPKKKVAKKKVAKKKVVKKKAAPKKKASPKKKTPGKK